MVSLCCISKNCPKNWLQTVPLSIRRKSEAKNSGPPRQKTHKWTNKRSTQQHQCWLICSNRPLNKCTLGTARKHCDDLFVFSFTKWLGKVQSIVQVTASLFWLPQFWCTVSTETRFPSSVTEMCFSWKGWFRAAESTFTHSHWPQRTVFSSRCNSRALPTSMA